MSRLAFFASSPIELTDSNPTRIRMATHAWIMAKLNPCGEMTETAFGWNWKVSIGFFGSVPLSVPWSGA